MGKVITAMLVAIFPILAQYLGGLILIILQFITDIIHGVCMFLVEALTNVFIINTDMLSGKDKIMTSLVNDFGKPFTALGISALFLIASWHVFKGFFSFLGLGTEEEEAWKIGLKCILYGVLVYESRGLCYYILKIFETVINDLQLTKFNVTWINDYGKNFTTFLNGNVDSEVILNTVGEAYLGGANQVLNIIISIMMLGFFIATDLKLLAIAVDLGEKYVRTAFLIIIAPLSIACGVTKATNQIFSAWVKTFTGLLISVFIKYFLLKVYSESMQKILYTYDGGNMIKSAVVIIALVSLIEQSDELSRQLGFQAGKIMGAPSEALAKVLRK